MLIFPSEDSKNWIQMNYGEDVKEFSIKDVKAFNSLTDILFSDLFILKGGASEREVRMIENHLHGLLEFVSHEKRETV